MLEPRIPRLASGYWSTLVSVVRGCFATVFDFVALKVLSFLPLTDDSRRHLYRIAKVRRLPGHGARPFLVGVRVVGSLPDCWAVERGRGAEVRGATPPHSGRLETGLPGCWIGSVGGRRCLGVAALARLSGVAFCRD